MFRAALSSSPRSGSGNTIAAISKRVTTPKAILQLGRSGHASNAYYHHIGGLGGGSQAGRWWWSTRSSHRTAVLAVLGTSSLVVGYTLFTSTSIPLTTAIQLDAPTGNATSKPDVQLSSPKDSSKELGYSYSSSPSSATSADSNESLLALIRAYFVYVACSIPSLVDNAPVILSTVESIPIVRHIANAMIRYTFFDHVRMLPS